MRSWSNRSRRYSVTAIVSATAFSTVIVATGSRAPTDVPVPRWSHVATTNRSSSTAPA